jgi:hypothetical protein
MSIEMRSFLNLLYSLCKQYISWYEANIKNAAPVNAKTNGSSNLSVIVKAE